MPKTMLEWTPPAFAEARYFSPSPESADPLRDFVAWFVRHAPAVPMTTGLRDFVFFGNGPGIRLYKRGRFQAQLFVCLPNSAIPVHSHPNVDSFELHVGGDLDFRVNGVPSLPMSHLNDRRNGVGRWWGRGVRVPPGCPHDLTVGPAGGAFISLQHWLAGEPTSVDLDWCGPAMDGAHAGAIETAREVEAADIEAREDASP